MSQELERVYTINLGKVKLSQSQHRAVRAINMIREFAQHHMKVETIKIEEELAHEVWAKGVRSPPRKVRVRMSKTEEGYVLVSRYDEEVETKVSPEKETKKVSDKVEPAKEAPKKEEPAKEAPKKEEPAKEAPKKEEPAKEAPKKEEPAKEAPKKD
ncbi:MAG: 50S ribosomal protein L31e [Candidatus Nitrosopumilus sp. bin_6a]